MSFLLLLSPLSLLSSAFLGHSDALAKHSDANRRTFSPVAHERLSPRTPGLARHGREAQAADSVVLTVRRLDQGEGEVEVVNAIPLRPGMLRPREVSRARITVEGHEVRATIVPTTALHSDGTVRSVLVRFSATLRSADRLPAVLRLNAGGGRAAPAPSTGDIPALPAAVALPESPDYLIATDLVGPTISVRESKRLGGVWSKYENDFDQWADKHWSTSGASWSAGNYYDRVQIYYAWWVRTGDIEYWRRATLMAVDYRVAYLEKNRYGSSHHWSQLEGLALHYVLTGDERSRLAVERTAQILSSYYRRGQLGNTRHHDMESRIQARSLLAALLAWEVQNGAEGLRSAGFAVPAEVAASAGQWERDLPRMLEQILSVQAPDGAYHWGGYCGASINYMNGILNDVLIRYHSRFRGDSAIVQSVRRNADWLWSTQWRPDGSFHYQSAACPTNKSGPSKATDLNLLFVTTFGWLYQKTGDGRYRSAGDQVFAAGLKGAFLQGTKQFNQQYTSSYRYLAYRRGVSLP